MYLALNNSKTIYLIGFTNAIEDIKKLYSKPRFFKTLWKTHARLLSEIFFFAYLHHFSFIRIFYRAYLIWKGIQKLTFTWPNNLKLIKIMNTILMEYIIICIQSSDFIKWILMQKKSWSRYENILPLSNVQILCRTAADKF